jgi:hypothetical protein
MHDMHQCAHYTPKALPEVEERYMDENSASKSGKRVLPVSSKLEMRLIDSMAAVYACKALRSAA